MASKMLNNVQDTSALYLTIQERTESIYMYNYTHAHLVP
jgi:hypothetical protein